MATKILDIDVSDKSNDELRHIVETLGLNNLSEKSMKKLVKFPEEMRKQWIENPDTTGEFTDDSVKDLFKSFTPAESEKIDEKKIYSPAYADVIRKLDKQAYDAACGSYESSFDRQAAHYDNFFDTMKASGLNINSKELDFLCERVSMGNYESDRDKFIASEIQKTGGKFMVIQPDYVTDDIGRKLRNRIDDIECAVGDELGLPDSKDKNIFITPTIPAHPFGGNPSFAVYYSNNFGNADIEIKNALLEEIRDMGYPTDDFEVGDSYPADASEIDLLKKEDFEDIKKPSYALSAEARQELEHAQTVLNNGYDEEGYNEDGYDETGHSKDGDYDPRYDQAYTDQGPDF